MQDIRRKNFTTKLFQRVPALYSYQTWGDTPEYAPLVARRVAELMVDWSRNVRDHDEVVHIAIVATLLWLALSLVGWWGRRRLRAWPGEGEPPFWSRASSAAGIVTLRILSVASPIVFLYATLASTQGLPEAVDWLFYVAAQSSIIVLAVSALVTTVLAPGSARWRLIPASDQAATRLCGLIILLAVVYGLSSLAYVATVQVQAPFALTMVIAFSSSLLTCAIVVAILLTPLGGERQDGLPRLRWPKALRAPIWVAMAAIVVSALAGYLSLSRFLARQLIVTGSILALLYLLLLWVEGFAQSLSDDGSAAGRWLMAKAGLERRRREQLAVPFSLLLKFLVLALSVPLIMVQWGYAWPDIYDWYRQLFFGFHIANTEVSLAVLFASIIVFGVAYAAARLFQGWLDSRILKPAGVSGGVRELDTHRRRLCGRRDRGACRFFLCGLEPLQSRHRGWSAFCRDRLWPPEHRQQLRLGPDPSGRAADQNWRSRRGRGRGRICAQDKHTLHRGRDLRSSACRGSEFLFHH